MKKPEDIKKGLEYCDPIEIAQGCRDCPYDKDCYCRHSKDKDALALIQHLETANAEKDKRIGELEKELEAVKRERDAAVADITDVVKNQYKCFVCAHFKDANDEYCSPCLHRSNWKWRGVCPENTEVQDGNQTDNA